jgi:hypothetical protein
MAELHPFSSSSEMDGFQDKHIEQMNVYVYVSGLQTSFNEGFVRLRTQSFVRFVFPCYDKVNFISFVLMSFMGKQGQEEDLQRIRRKSRRRR